MSFLPCLQKHIATLVTTTRQLCAFENIFLNVFICIKNVLSKIDNFIHEITL